MGFAFDFDAQTSESADQPLNLIPGWCQLRLIDVCEDNDGNLVLEYKISGGPNDNRKVSDKVFDPEGADTPEKAKKGRDRVLALALRLGLVKRGSSGTFDGEFAPAIGWEGFGHLQVRPFTRRDGTKGETVDLGYMGIFPRMYEDTTAENAKNHRKYPRGFPEEWRKANTVPHADPLFDRPGVNAPPVGATSVEDRFRGMDL